MNARSIARNVIGFAGTSAALAAIVITAPATPAPAGAAVTSRPAAGCDYTVHVHSNPGERTRTYVTGTCNGHAPTAGRIARDLRGYVLPPWLHTFAMHRHSWGVCGGNCASSAEVTDRGQAYTS